MVIALDALVAITAVVMSAVALVSRNDDSADDTALVMDGHSMESTFTDGDEL